MSKICSCLLDVVDATDGVPGALVDRSLPFFLKVNVLPAEASIGSCLAEGSGPLVDCGSDGGDGVGESSLGNHLRRGEPLGLPVYQCPIVLAEGLLQGDLVLCLVAVVLGPRVCAKQLRHLVDNVLNSLLIVT